MLGEAIRNWLAVPQRELENVVSHQGFSLDNDVLGSAPKSSRAIYNPGAFLDTSAMVYRL